METTIMGSILYWGYIGIMENKMDTTIWVLGYGGFTFLGSRG